MHYASTHTRTHKAETKVGAELPTLNCAWQGNGERVANLLFYSLIPTNS